jgi:enediyne biosynthesis protein E4
MKQSSGLIGVVLLFLVGCSSNKQPADPLFVALDGKQTGLTFANKLTYSPSFNLFTYMYFYNGSGVGAGDFNRDGRIDLFFGSNQGQNALYLNTGNLKFKDATATAGIPNDGGWTTGISVVDINNDGLLDIYVCRVGQYETLRSKNQLLINQGLDKDSMPHFADKAAAYGLDFSGFSTQAAFFDYDNDSDLDMFLLNHAVHQNNNFRPRAAFQGTYDPLSGDRIYRNDGTHFVDVTKETGINSTAISYGLGVAVSDMNLDGYPDLYVGNDFHENDYLYINQRNGTFKEEGEQCFMHTSQYSMGVDVADINNDAFPEIISVDMLSADPYILKRSLGESSYDIFQEKLNSGYSYQYTRNNLQFNRGNGLFSETGLFSGVAATDWSWAPLWMDFDNDGLKDLFISNGIPKRLNDIDYVNFIASDEIQQRIMNKAIQAKEISLIDRFPEIKIPNKFYHNNGELSFSDEEKKIGNGEPGYSNGAVYADFDNDGDLDIVVNNIDAPVTLYENKATAGEYLQLDLKGPDLNRAATGAKVVLFSGPEVRTYDNFPVKGFLSSMEIPIQIGLKNTTLDSLFIIWPDRTFEPITIAKGENKKVVDYKPGLPVFDFTAFANRKKPDDYTVSDITASTGLQYRHQENRFVEFDREPLIPHMISTESPCLAVADINRDGLEDVFVGGSRGYKPAVYMQQASGKFQKASQPYLDLDSSYEDTDACWADIDKDGDLDLLVASGGNEFYGRDAHNTPRIYSNDGKGSLTKMANPFGELYMTASAIVPNDFNGDGYTDLFIGGRTVPWGYGQIPQSCLLLNNKNGTFTNVTETYARDLKQVGLVTRAIWFDIDKDNDKDLLLSLEWGGLVAYINNSGKFSKKVLTDKKGWWSFIMPVDVNGDGQIDLLAGNLGLNSRLQATEQKPVRLYYNDFDDNGEKEQVLTYYVGEREIPFANKTELERRMPFLKKRFLYAEDLAKASLREIFGEEKLRSSTVLSADYFKNALLLNKGGLNFEVKGLPWEAQLSTYKDAVVVDANNDNKPDILLGGNYYDNNVEMGRYDADFGTLLINKGNGSFRAAALNGLAIKGQVRSIKQVFINKSPAYIIARNNDSLKVVRIGHGQPLPAKR